MAKTKCLTPVERAARQRKIEALIRDARQKAVQHRFAGGCPQLEMARFLDDLADVAERYLEEKK